MSPSQFQILREDFQAMRLEFQASIRELVTRETFADERRRVDERFEGHGRELGELKRGLEAEAQVRITQAAEDAKAKIAEARERERLRRQTAWQWFGLAATLVGGPILGGLIGAALSASGIGAGP